VTLMVLGIGAMDLSLARIARRMKKGLALALFVASFVLCLMMGYLSSKDFTQSYMNWAAEMVNLLGQGSLLWGVMILHRAGLADELN
jgi:protein-S-isoprenylcysteine O-methyltransferase Ste14